MGMLTSHWILRQISQLAAWPSVGTKPSMRHFTTIQYIIAKYDMKELLRRVT